MFTPHFKKLKIFLSWKGKAIGLCPSGRSLRKRKWSWNFAIQDRILYLGDVIKRDRDIEIMHTSRLLAHAVLSSMKDEWWCFICCTSKRQQWHITRGRKINPQPWMRNHRWKNREHEVHRSGFTIELHRREKTLRKAKEIRYVLRNQFFRLEMIAQLLLQNMGWILQGQSRYAIS